MIKKRALFFFSLLILNLFSYSYFLNGNWRVILSSLNYIKPGNIITLYEESDTLYIKNVPFTSRCVYHHNDDIEKKYSYCKKISVKVFGIYTKTFILCQIHFSNLHVYECEKMEIPRIILRRIDLYIFNQKS